MSSHGNEESIRAEGKESDCSETTVEIKIKTLDSQTYTLRVDKYVSVPALKEQIANVTGVLSEQQRLICRGKVLKDDQLLSAYHVEDGHTLHLVVRQPLSTSNTGSTGTERTASQSWADPTVSSTHSRANDTEANDVVLGTFNISDQGSGAMPDINRILSAVLASVGIVSSGTRNEESSSGVIGPERRERMVGATVMMDSGSLQPEQTTSRSGSLHSTFRVPTAFSFGPLIPSVLPDSLTTISQYLSNLRQDLMVNDQEHAFNVQTDVRNTDRQNPTTTSQNPTTTNASPQVGLPTPATLAEVVVSVRQFLVQDLANQLAQLAGQLHEEANVTATLARAGIQSNGMRTGILLQNSGALLLELGRATMTLRMGQTASNAVVNAGPPVFISTVGPNPMMVQSLPSTSGTGFGNIPVGIMQPGHAFADGALGTSFVPRNIDIRIQRGPMVSNQGEHPVDNQQVDPQDQERPTNVGNPVHNAQPVSGFPSFATESGRIRVVPIRTVVAAVPAAVARPVGDGSSSSSLGVFYPLLARIQNLDSGNSTDSSRHVRSVDINRSAEPSQPLAQSLNSGQVRSSSTEVSPVNVDSGVASSQHQGGSGSGSTFNTIQEPSGAVPSVTIIDTQSQGNVAPDNQHSQAASRFDAFLHTIFGGDQMHISGNGPDSRADLQETAPGNERTRETEQITSDQGDFLSQLLHQVMPIIQQHLVHQANPSLPASGDLQESPAGSNAAVDNRASSPTESVQLTSSTSQGERKRYSEGSSSEPQSADDNGSSSPGSKRQRR